MQVGFARVIWAEYIAPILLLTAFLHQSRVECGRFGLLRRFTHPISDPVTEFALVSKPSASPETSLRRFVSLANNKLSERDESRSLVRLGSTQHFVT